ncbi:MAG: TolC family protein, partial [Calditrichaeota bacterium]|nr:TolC family protein [Calditrichota bacterium]
ILAGIKPDMFPKIARRVALNLQRILLGEAPGDIPYAFSAGEELCFNMATARQIGVYPDWALITEAVLLNDQRTEVAQHWALQSAVLEGMRVNQDLLAKSREVAAGQQNIGTARANLLPQIDLSATAVQIDADRAGTFQAEQTVSGSATLTQVLFSDDAWANLSVQQSLQRSLEQEYGAERLNIAQHIATAYLQVLNAKTLERVQKENLKLSRSNLELARVRESVGFSGRSEVYRWESQIASNRQAVINANSLRNIAEIQFNRVLNRPLEEKFSTRETGMEDEGLLSEQGRLFRYMANPVSFKILRTFFVSEGLANSPEL